MDEEALHRNLIRVMWGYEAIVIATCFVAGLILATSGGGSPILSLPLLLIAAAEMMRIPLAAWSTRLPFYGQILGAIVLLAIAVGSFEGLSLAFEQFVNARVIRVMEIQNELNLAKDVLDQKNKLLEDAEDVERHAEDARNKVSHDLEVLTKNQPQGMSTENGRAGLINARTVSRQVGSHLAQVRDLRSDEKSAMRKVESALKSIDEIKRNEVGPATTIYNGILNRLEIEKQSSPMHRLGATIYGVKVKDLTEDQFETVKKYAVFGLAGAFATLSMLVSIVAHTPPKGASESKLSRAFRAYLARRRKKLTIQKPVEVPGPERVVLKWVAYDFNTGRRINPDLTLGESADVKKSENSNNDHAPFVDLNNQAI